MSATAWIAIGLGGLLGIGSVGSALDYRRICRRDDRERRLRRGPGGAQ